MPAHFLNPPLLILAVTLVLSVSSAAAVGDAFSAGALRGVMRVNVHVEGIPAKYERYGLTAEELGRNTERRLREYGIDVVDEQAAREDREASQINVRLWANEDTFAQVSYRVSVMLKRKLPLDRDGQAFVAETVWSDGQSGLLNPSDLPRIYAYVETLIEHFIDDHGRHNPGA